MVLISLMVCLYYNVIICYGLYYLLVSLTSMDDALPWSTCGNPWNTNHCITGKVDISNMTDVEKVNATLRKYLTRLNGCTSDGCTSDGCMSNGCKSDGCTSDGCTSDGCTSDGCTLDGVPLELMYVVFTSMPGEIYRRRFGCLFM